MALVVTGLMNKQVAAEIGIAEVTVKVHRHNIMKKLGAKSLPELVRMADILEPPHVKEACRDLIITNRPQSRLSAA